MAREQGGGHNREEESEEPQKSSRQSSHRDRPLEKRAHPAEEESPQGTETAVEVDVRAACLGECRAQFGITESAKEHDETADNPRCKNQGGCADGAGHVTGDKKNARANGVANNDRSRRPQTQAAN